MEKEHILRSTTEDKTEEIREILKSEYSTLKFSGEAITHGITKNDLEKEYFTASGQSLGKVGDVGSNKILRVVGLKDRHITGGKFINPKYAFKPEDRPERKKKDVDENSMLLIEDCENISFTNMELVGPHTDVREKTGFPVFYGSREFAHGVEIVSNKNIYFRGLKISNVPGDGFYLLRKGAGFPDNEHITIVNSIVDWNGRQGVAWGDGNYVLIEGCVITASGRGDFDIEPPKQYYHAENIIIRNNKGKSWLLFAPNGGRGITRNVIWDGNEYETNSPTTHVQGDWSNSIRENITFKNNKRFGGFGSPNAAYRFICAEGITLDNEHCPISDDRSGEIVELIDCKNVKICRSNFPNAKYIVLKDTPIEEVTVFDNRQDLKFIVWEYEGERGKAPYYYDDKYKDAKGGYDWNLWKEDYKKYEDYLNERNKTGISKIVDIVENKDDSKGAVHKTWKPYKGVDEGKTLEPIFEAREPFVPEPVPEPDKPIDMDITKEQAKEIFKNEETLEEYIFQELLPEMISRQGKFTVTPDKLQFLYRERDYTLFETLYMFNGKRFPVIIEIVDEIVEPELPIEEKPEVPEEPTTDPKEKPIENEEEALDAAQKILDFLKKKSSKIGIAVLMAVIILLIILI